MLSEWLVFADKEKLHNDVYNQEPQGNVASQHPERFKKVGVEFEYFVQQGKDGGEEENEEAGLELC